MFPYGNVDHYRSREFLFPYGNIDKSHPRTVHLLSHFNQDVYTVALPGHLATCMFDVMTQLLLPDIFSDL